MLIIFWHLLYFAAFDFSRYAAADAAPFTHDTRHIFAAALLSDTGLKSHRHFDGYLSRCLPRWPMPQTNGN